jgi:hypothetical protein
MSTPVNTADGPYAVAIAELPLSAHRSPERTGAIIVVPGDAGWRDSVRRARDDGAAAIIVRSPGSADADEIDSSRDRGSTPPVVMERQLLRADVASDARQLSIPDLSLIQIECRGSSAEFDTVFRDAIGWARVLGGGSLDFLGVTTTSRGVCVLLERAAADAGSRSVAVTVLASRRAAPAWIRAVAIGTDRVEVTVDNARQAVSVESATVAGRRALPPRWESVERVVLRRAIEVASAPETSHDFEEWEHDEALSVLCRDRAHE